MAAAAQVWLNPTGPGDAYALIESKGYGIETPDCGHAVKHVAIAADAELGKDVFVFTLHRDRDHDRCENFDRQRVEIKTWNKSPKHMTGENGETHTYRWKFKLDAGFKPSSSFTHIHQIKAQGGSDDDAPILTITPRAGSPEKLQIIHIPSGGSATTVADADLSLFKGAWVDAEETIQFADQGTVKITLRRAKDGAVLLAWSDQDIDTWRAGAELIRPKYGIYRSLNNKADLRDESVNFADFCLAEGTTACPFSEAASIRAAPPRVPAPGGNPVRWYSLDGRLGRTYPPFLIR